MSKLRKSGRGCHLLNCGNLCKKRLTRKKIQKKFMAGQGRFMEVYGRNKKGNLLRLPFALQVGLEPTTP